MDHSIGTLVPCRVGVIPHDVMKDITERHPRLARAIWKDTLVDAAVFREWITGLGRRDAYERIAHLMCEVYVRMEMVGRTDNGSVDWPITQADMADALGLSSVHVNRSLMKLRSDGLITLSKTKLRIPDWEALKRAGDLDPSYLHRRTDQEPSANAEGPRLERRA